MQYWLLVLITLCVSNNAMSKERIVSLGNDITEIIFALNFGDNIIAQSTLGSLAQISPTIEDIKRIDPQRIVSMRPTLVLAATKLGIRQPYYIYKTKEYTLLKLLVE